MSRNKQPTRNIPRDDSRNIKGGYNPTRYEDRPKPPAKPPKSKE